MAADSGGQQHAPSGRDNEQDEVTTDLPSGQAEGTDVDDVLDEIDSVLEENAEDFVRGYVQKGGQ